MAATKLIAMHKRQGKSTFQSIKDRLDYAKNPDKTDHGQLVSSYECDPRLVEEQFAISKRDYIQNTGRKYAGDVIAYQIRQSFMPGEITPEEANRIGYETAMRWTKGNYAFIVATHIDMAHIHNHIIYNAVNLKCTGKYRNFLRSGLALQKVSDLVCLENGLSVITPKPRYQRNLQSDKVVTSEKKLDLLLNIQEIIAKGKGRGYEIWAKRHNIKQIAQTLLILEERGIRDMETLEKKASEASDRFDENAVKLKNLQGKLNDLKELKMHIINYSRTKETYVQYRKKGYSKNFLEEHREDILLHKAAKEAFGKLSGPVPKIREINAQIKEISAEKSAIYKEYLRTKDEMKELQTAKYNVEQLLGEEERGTTRKHRKDREPII
jgi:hypothetical protein